MGCLFALFNLSGLAFLTLMVGITLRALGIIQFNWVSAPWVLPLVGLSSFFILALLAFAFRSVRRLSTPLDEMLSASERVAQGDYSARVDERGLPEMRSLANGFNSMASRLQASDLQRRSMLADVSHELRTPLTVIRGSVEGMMDGLYPADEQHLRAILDETHILSRLVDDLRTLALAEGGALQLRREPVDLLALIKEEADSHASLAEAGGVTLEVRGVSGPPMRLDPLRVREVLGNLIGNAIRYTPRGGAVRLTLKGKTVTVEDDGPGIPPEDLPHIFERFYKSSDSGGMGLGLSIARYLVEAHGGTIRAESAPGEGTRIIFTLPDNSPA